MHMILRTILIFLKKSFLKKVHFGEKTVISMRVLPVDLDLLWHVNNGVYFSFMDFGRWDAVFRNGSYDLCKKMGWYAVVAGETIRFKKSLKLWDKFQLETQITGHDDKYFFIQQKFLKNGELMATGMVKVRFLKKKGGTVPTEELLKCIGEHAIPDARELSDQWFALDQKYLD